MRIIKTIIFFILLTYSILFCIENFQRTSISLPFIAKVESAPLFLIMIGCVILGVLIGSLISTFRGMRGYIGHSSVRSENKNLKKKVDIYETEKKIQDNLLENPAETTR